MKKLLLIMGFCCSINIANAQGPSDNRHAFQDSHHNVLGYIRSGQVIDPSNNYLGEYKRVGAQIEVIDGHHNVIGYILPATREMQNASHTTVGYYEVSSSDYNTTVKDAARNVIGYVKTDGKVENAAHTVIGYQTQTEHNWTAAYFFLLKF